MTIHNIVQKIFPGNKISIMMGKFVIIAMVLLGIQGIASAQDPEHVRILMEAYRQLRGVFDFTMNEATITRGNRSLVAYNTVSYRPGSPQGSIELHVSSGQPTSVWVSVPDNAWRTTQTPVGFYGWHEFRRDATGHWKEEKRPHIISAPYFPSERDQPPVLTGSGDWGAWDEYYDEAFWRGNDPPHWTPIAVAREGAPWIGEIHDKLNREATHGDGIRLLDRFRPGSDDLTDRAMEAWQPVTLRGIVVMAGLAGGDFGADHTYSYSIDGRTFHGGLGEETRSEWPGMDWDINVSPDRDMRYLLNNATTEVGSSFYDQMGVEIEHFAVPPQYRPVEGEWLQVIGRWATDNGHSLFRTEIHPPELLVSSRHTSPGQTDAKVIATGAWLGEDLSFVVYPPKRPNPSAVLRWEVTLDSLQRVNLDLPGISLEGYERGFSIRQLIFHPIYPRGGRTAVSGAPILERSIINLDEGRLPERWIQRIVSAGIDVIPWPSDQPNHLVCIIRNPGGPEVITHNSGSVSMQSERGHQSMIRVWWETETATVTGTVRTSTGLACRGADLYYMDGSVTGNGWNSVSVADDGTYRITELLVGVPYLIRPAGSKWNFRSVPIRRIFHSGENVIDFVAEVPATARFDPLPQDFYENYRRFRPLPGSRLTLRLPTSASSSANQLQQLKDQLAEILLSVAEPGPMGVVQNGFELPESGDILVSLASFVGPDGNPISSFEQAYRESQASQAIRDLLERMGEGTVDPVLELAGSAGLGVANARLRATLWAGNEKVGFRKLNEVEATTNLEGLAAFRLKSGTHCDRVLIVLEVISNTVNPWFLPKLTLMERSFPPAASGDDFIRYKEYALKRWVPSIIIGTDLFSKIKIQADVLDERVLSVNLDKISVSLSSQKAGNSKQKTAKKITLKSNKWVEVSRREIFLRKGNLMAEKFLEHRRESVRAYVYMRALNSKKQSLEQPRFKHDQKAVRRTDVKWFKQ